MRDHIHALFLPETGSDLKTITDQLAAAGFDAAHTHMLGTGPWDVQGLGRQYPLLLRGWYGHPIEHRAALLSPAMWRLMVRNRRVSRLSLTMRPRLRQCWRNAARRMTTGSLTNPYGFAGLDGIFRLTGSGLVERGMAVIQVTADGAHVIDPAPASFVAKH